MTITAQFLSQCIEDQINKGVAWLTIKEWGYGNEHKRKSIDYYCSHGLLNSVNAGNVNYCTNPNDIMPIAFANNISITTKPDEHIGKPFAFSTGVLGRTVHCDSNSGLLRAICEVYILMSVVK